MGSAGRGHPGRTPGACACAPEVACQRGGRCRAKPAGGCLGRRVGGEEEVADGSEEPAAVMEVRDAGEPGAELGRRERAGVGGVAGDAGEIGRAEFRGKMATRVATWISARPRSVRRPSSVPGSQL